jgi:hypothetical protein
MAGFESVTRRQTVSAGKQVAQIRQRETPRVTTCVDHADSIAFLLTSVHVIQPFLRQNRWLFSITRRRTARCCLGESPVAST